MRFEDTYFTVVAQIDQCDVSINADGPTPYSVSRSRYLSGDET